MAKSKILRVFLTLFFVLFISSILVAGTNFQDLEVDNQEDSFYSASNASIRPFNLNYVSFDPIKIINDSNFTDYGFPGYGNITHPYIIENYLINETDENGISIVATTKHFLIRNCFLQNLYRGIYIYNIANGTALVEQNYCTENTWGIYIRNATSAKVEDNVCTNNGYGIQVRYSEQVILGNNTCNFNVYPGLVVENCSSSTVTNNNCSFNEDYGIAVSESQLSHITNNFCYSNECGMISTGSDSSVVNGNICNNNERGIIIWYSPESIVFNNTVKFSTGGRFNYGEGILLGYYSSNSFVSNNTCYGNIYGISVSCNNSILKHNLLQENQFFGIRIKEIESIEFSFNNIIYHNYFIDNNINGHEDGKTQAFDFSKTNLWYDSNTKTGNWWSDIGLKCKYKISKVAGIVDLYPLNKVNFCLKKLLPTIIVPLVFIAAIVVLIKYPLPYFSK
jgi:parallel beta-helix repeat protein